MAILYNKFRLSISDRVKNVSNLGSIKCQISAGCSLALLSFYLCNIIRTVFMTWQALYKYTLQVTLVSRIMPEGTVHYIP